MASIPVLATSADGTVVKLGDRLQVNLVGDHSTRSWEDWHTITDRGFADSALRLVAKRPGLWRIVSSHRQSVSA